jgi:hypothetical protein
MKINRHGIILENFTNFTGIITWIGVLLVISSLAETSESFYGQDDLRAA